MFVNSIEITNSGNDLRKGEEFAYFSFGSTIVMLFEKNTFQLKADLLAPSEVKYGEVIGTIRK
jgi:phosphatidylserine decarboxylase